METLQPIYMVIFYLTVLVIFYRAHRECARKSDRALDAMIEYEEQSPHGPWHLVYRHYYRMGYLWQALVLYSLYKLITETHNVFTLITA